MAFKKTVPQSSSADTPAKLFQSLTRRGLPDVMTHQRDMLDAYVKEALNEPDVALQLPTGSGKTLVGLLIGEWRRRKFKQRVVYLCPTKQLVNQTVEQAQSQYGIDAVAFTSSKRDYSAQAKAAYTTGSNIAVTTYSSLFNVNPFFSDPDIVIVDDAHAAENYIAKMWSIEIPAGDAGHADLHSAISGLLRPYITDQSHSRLTGEWTDSSDANWVDKIPSSTMRAIAARLGAILDAHSPDLDDVRYRWSLLRDHLEACHLYIASREIVIRPLIPPVWAHAPYADARQRIYMSATLGAGGDLERLTGTPSIKRIAAPEGFRAPGVGRRFFVFPGLSLEGDETDALRLRLQQMAGRSVVLVPSDAAAEQSRAEVAKLPGFETFSAVDIEASKKAFVSKDKAVAIMAGRFDGIDFPHDECRLLCLDGLPKATNAQERFLMTKMGASALFNERLQTRVLQAAGRCTRALQDRSAVFVTGHELLDYLADDRNWSHFHPELQAELHFGVQQSREVAAADIITNFQTFLENNADWAEANQSILDSVDDFEQTPYAAMDALQLVVKSEVKYQKALWAGDPETALKHARDVLAGLSAPELRGYRALWHYLAGSLAEALSAKPGDGNARIAKEQFAEARKAAPGVGWLRSPGMSATGSDSDSDAPALTPAETEAMAQAERMESVLLALGTVSERQFEKKAKRILSNLAGAKLFEEGQKELGELLGFVAGNDESDAAPDPWWLGQSAGIVFEDHAGGEAGTVFSATKAKQARSHPDWIIENVPGAADLEITAILVTPTTKAYAGAKPSLKHVMYWKVDDYRDWARKAVDVVRELKAKLPPASDLFWREEAGKRLVDEKLTLAGIVDGLKTGADAMEFQGDP